MNWNKKTIENDYMVVTGKKMDVGGFEPPVWINHYQCILPLGVGAD